MDGGDRNMVNLPSKISDITPKIFNFPDYSPTNDELSILSLGFKYCPTPKKPSLLGLEVDINEFVRKIELTSFFAYSSQNNEECIARNKSDYCPPESQDFILTNKIKHIKMYGTNLDNLPLPKVYDNISVSERNAIYSLKDNNNIIITSVDKGGAIVILNRVDYVNYMNNYLSDGAFY